MTALPLAREQGGAPAAARALAVRRLELRDFRNYRHLVLEPAGPGPIVLHGENGAGKTNLLEAVSMLAPGRGLRRARLAELDREGGGGPWSVGGLVDGHLGPVELLTARDPDAERRGVAADGQAMRSQNGLGELVSLLWLTPAMDRLFADGASARRRFLDRLVLAVDPGHAARVAAFERSLRERSHLLRNGRGHDAVWLAAIERRIAESAVAVAAARRQLVRDLDAELRDASFPFPRPRLALAGEVETWLEDLPALAAEQRLAEALARNRALDAETGGAAVGPHRSDLVATDASRGGEPAERCSTGRQKAFLVSVVLAEARLRRARHGDLPILLLDEVTAHLDPRRRAELFAALVELGAQVWLTGTEAGLFAPLRPAAQVFHVANGALTPDDER
jgi:DNA replication and repair protein RecF